MGRHPEQEPGDDVPAPGSLDILPAPKDRDSCVSVRHAHTGAGSWADEPPVMAVVASPEALVAAFRLGTRFRVSRGTMEAVMSRPVPDRWTSSLRPFARSANGSHAYPAPEGAGLRRDRSDQSMGIMARHGTTMGDDGPG
jgi:hypothetical protein